MAQAGWSDKRPLSPHLQVWRWHVTMATSIFHRASGTGNTVGALVFVGWLAALASGPDAYEGYMAVLTSPLGLLVMFGITASYCYHLANGIRHLVWDAGRGYDPKTANASGWAVIAAGALGAVAVFALAFLA
jgi:succinate dehydrogenase / fumarate reductase, cytochrome b subunit